MPKSTQPLAAVPGLPSPLPDMNNTILTPVVSIIAGCCVLMFPALLNYVVAIYLILTGVLAIANKN